MKAHYIIVGLLLLSASFYGCKNTTHTHTTVADEQKELSLKKTDQLNYDYPKIPDDKILENNNPNTPIYTELKGRYKDYLTRIKRAVDSADAKFVVIIITPEAGKTSTNSNVYGIPFIKSTCSQLGIECVDMTPAIATQDLKVITQTPRDGHWSKKGAIFLANQLAAILKRHSDAKSKVTYKDTERPETFGDLPPNDDEILDGGKDLPYHLLANAQGCRMTHNIKFPKQKQHVLFLGGSQIYSPFLDNEFIATALLEKQFPNMELINTGMIASSVDDYLSLFQEKAKYAEPDLVIMQTNGGDITDLFFSNRNHLGRSHKPYYPSPTEEKYYNSLYKK